MPELVVPGAALLTLYWSRGTTGFVNVFGCSVIPTTTINQALANTLGTAIKAAVPTSIGGILHSTVALAAIGIRDIRTPNVAEYRDVGAAVAGSGPGDALPPSVAIVCTLRTGKSGQSFRGRNYFGGLTEAANNTSGTFDGASSTGITGFVNAISTALVNNGLQLAVVSRPSERKTVVTTVFHADGTQDVDTSTIEARAGQVTVVTSIALRNTAWDSQRRRGAAGSTSTLFSQPISTVEIAQLPSA